MPEKVPILVVVGVDIDGKPHASRFAEADAPLVARAAELMRFQMVRVSPGKEDLHGLAEQLPLGKIFASGRAFVPFVSRVVFDKLAPLVKAETKTRSSRAIGRKRAAASYPVAAVFEPAAVKTANMLWGKIEIGSVVLASQPDVWGPGWWEGVVIGLEGDELILRWMDTPAEEAFRATRRDVALRHPAAD